MRAFVARPPGRARRPGILVFQEAFGVNGHIRDVARRLAGEGYVALAPELFHRTAPGFEGDYGDFSTVQPHLQALTVAGLEADIRAAYGWLAADPQSAGRPIAAIGFCMGGRVSYLANAILPLAASVSLYGGGIAPALLERATRLAGPALFFWGGLDRHIPPEQHRAVADALRTAGKRFVDVEISDADHGFFCDARPSYHARAAAEAWALIRAFLGDALRAGERGRRGARIPGTRAGR